MMRAYISAGLFSAGQITAIVLVSVLLAALVALNVYIAYIAHKRGERKMQTKQLQLQREALLKKLAAMRAGVPLEQLQPIDEKPQIDEVDTIDAVSEDVDEDETASDVEEFVDGNETIELEVEVNEAGNVVRYNRSFTARITQADNDLKARYSELKNYLMAYRGIRARMSWRRETFHIGKRSVASFVVRGKTLCVCLATDPALFDNTKYKVVDVSGSKKKNTMPCLFRITSDRRTSYAKELIDVVMAGFNVGRQKEYKAADYTLPYKSTEVLVKRRLIKVVGNGIPDTAKEDALAAAKGIHYNRSIAARIIQSDDALKARYSKLKNYLMAHEGIVCADSWKRETFRQGRTTLAAFMIRGKTLCLCLATDPTQFAGTKYKVEDLSKRSKSTNTPLLYRIKNDRRIAYALQLIDKVFAEHNVAKAEVDYVNYAVPFTATETLVRRGLIRVTEGVPKFVPPKAEGESEQAMPEAAATSDAQQPSQTAEQTTAPSQTEQTAEQTTAPPQTEQTAEQATAPPQTEQTE